MIVFICLKLHKCFDNKEAGDKAQHRFTLIQYFLATVSLECEILINSSVLLHFKKWWTKV